MQHTYQVRVDWTGNDGDGTRNYKSYRRDHVITVHGKTPILGSSDPSFRGDASRYNPEELLVASLSSCHMLWFLHYCSVNQIRVESYVDTARGVMEERPDGSGAFVSVQLQPLVQVAAGDDVVKASALHEAAHRACFIANSVRFPVEVAPRVVSEA